MTKACLLALLLPLLSCSSAEKVRVVQGPHGVTAEIRQRALAATASDTLKVTLVSPRSGERVEVFSGSGGSRTDVVFDGSVVVVQYCYPTEYQVVSYVYSIGDDYDYADINVTAATVPAQIGSRRFCEGGIEGRAGRRDSPPR